MKKTRWLVTGAAGFIGSHIVDHLLSQQQEVLGIDNFSTGSMENVSRLEKKHGSSWECLKDDITNPQSMNTIFSDYQPDMVVHLAAKVSVSDSIKNPQATHDTNVGGFLNVIDAAKKSNVKRFIYASSSAVYGNQKTIPISETATLAPLSPYGLSKEMNERDAARFADTSLTCIGLRFFNVFGPYQAADSPYAAVIPKWLSLLQQAKPITIYGDGSATRDFCHVDNIKHAIFQLGTAELPVPHNIYNIGSGMATTLIELSQHLLALTHQDSTLIQHQPWPEGEILHSTANIQHAKKEWDYRVLVDLEEGLGSFFTGFSS